ncbi:MAG TPA: glycosyltransferase family 4 protein [Candidatus Binatia bacterium]|jgi:glycosyltransferase involved in cell wall biosynthesis
MGLRILCVTPWFPNYPTDGRFNFILHSIRALVGAGNEVTVLVTRPWVPKVFAMMNSNWIHGRLRREQFDIAKNIRITNYLSIPRYILSEFADFLYKCGTATTIRNLVNEHDIQIVHAHTERAGYGAVAVAQPLKVPVVVTLHGISTAPQLLDSQTKRQRLRYTLNGADRVVLVGEPLRAYFARLAGNDNNFRVVPNGFFLPEREQRADSRPWGYVIKFVSVSNLQEGKGVDLTLLALARIRVSGFENWIYSIIGEGAERTRLENMTDRLGLGDKVRFHGRLPHDSTLQRLADADVFVLPSYREAFGIAYLEAMASGLLTVGVRGQGPAAFITHGETGLLVEPNDVDSLYENLKLIFENKPSMQRLALSGKRFVRSEFTWARHAEKLIAVCEEALNQQYSSAKTSCPVNIH